MTADQRQKVQHAIEALIDVESALHHGEPASEGNHRLEAIRRKLSEAREALVDLNAPEYN